MEKVIYNTQTSQIDQEIDNAKDEIIKTLKEIIEIQEKQINLLKEQNAELSKND